MSHPAPKLGREDGLPVFLLAQPPSGYKPGYTDSGTRFFYGDFPVWERCFLWQGCDQKRHGSAVIFF